jgi:CDP-glycerol glycerophosphotransferase (TagB/SpsB family)
MKTVLFLLPIGLTIRNFVQTGVLSQLHAQSNVRIVALTSDPELAETPPDEAAGIWYDRLPDQAKLTSNRIIHRALAIRHDRIHENAATRARGRVAIMLYPWHYRALDRVLAQPFPRSRLISRGLRSFVERTERAPRSVKRIFETYEPSLIVATNPTRMTEQPMLAYAIKRGVPTVGIIKSWDVIRNKGYLPVHLDRYLVWTSAMKQDLMNLHDVSSDRVGVTGIPQFDVYAHPVAPGGKSEFLQRHGLDPDKRTVLFSTSSPTWIGPDEPEVLRKFVHQLSIATKGQVQVLARPHPGDSPARYEYIKHPHLAFQQPGSTSETPDERYRSASFLTDLRDALEYTDVVVNTASTMTLDAVAMGKPVVNMAIDLAPYAYERSTKRFYDVDSFIPVVNSKATRIVTSVDELVSNVIRYLDDPALEANERASLRELLCFRVDGRSAERMADFLNRALEQESFDE